MHFPVVNCSEQAATNGWNGQEFFLWKTIWDFLCIKFLRRLKESGNSMNLRGGEITSTYDRREPAVSYKWTGWVWEIHRWKSKIARKLPTILEEFIEYTFNLIKENRRMWTCKQLDLQTLLGSQPLMPKNLPNHWLELEPQNNISEECLCASAWSTYNMALCPM